MSSLPRLSPPPAPARLFARSQGRGPSVVCLHSSTGSHAQWRALADVLADALADQPCQVITPDLHGHGRSPDWPQAGAHTLDTDALGVLRAVEAADGDDAAQGLHLVGHSYGAAVALQIALRHPHRVRSLTLYEPAAFGILRAVSAADPALAEIEAIARSVEALVRRGELDHAARVFVDYWGGPDAWQAMTPAAREAVRVRVSTVPRHFDMLFRAAWTPALLSRLDLPVLLMQGTQTRASACRVAQWLGRSLPRVQRIEFAGAGHLGPITHAPAVNAAIVRHLQRVSLLQRVASRRAAEAAAEESALV